MNEARRAEMKAFEQVVPMTAPERELVKKWVEEGNSPFSNPFGLVNLEGGNMLNIIHALEENQYISEDEISSPKRYRSAEIIRIKELVVPGWEKAGEGLKKARI